MKRIVIALALALPLAAVADKLDCSIKAKKLATTAEMTAMAKVKDADARKTALDSLKTPGVSVVKGELEVEDGCLIYSYDIKVPGKSGVEEVFVDAGNGKVLRTKHESAAKEAAEKAADKAKAVTEKATDKVKAATEKATGQTGQK
jgi:hypothetical protein